MGKRRILNLIPPCVGVGKAWVWVLSATCVCGFWGHGAYADTAVQKAQRVGARLSTSSVSISTADSVDIDVIPSATGTLAVGKSSVTVTTDASGGYQLYISGLDTERDGLTALYYNGRADGASKLTGIAGTSPAEFVTANQWGYAVGGGEFAAENDYLNASNAGSITDRSTISSLTWRGISKDMRLVKSSTSTDPTAVYFGVYVNNDVMTGNYQNSVVYTAFVEGANKLEVYPTQVKDGDTMTITAEYLSSSLPVTNTNQIAVSLLNGSNIPVGTCDNLAITNNGSAGLLEFTCTVHTNGNFARNNYYDVAVELSHENRNDKLNFYASESWGTFDTLADFETMQDVSAQACANSSYGEYRLKDARTNATYTIRKMNDDNCWMIQNLWLAANTEYVAADGVTTFNTGNSFTTGWTTSVTGAMFYEGEHLDNVRYDDYYDAVNRPDGINNRGSFFNWKLVTANASGGYGIDQEATTSVCPQGWRLPETDDFVNLYTNAYGGSYAALNEHWHGVAIGRCTGDENCKESRGAYGFWWGGSQSLTTPSIRGVYMVMRASSGEFLPIDENQKHNGNTARCMLESNKSFQDFTQDDADAMKEDEIIRLTDTRDNKSYLVAKLKDGNVWMVQNLALAGGTTITSEDSDVAEDYTLPSSNAQGFSDNTKQYMYSGTHRDSTPDTLDTNTGAYYSWLTATAGSGVDMSSGNAPYSICPKSWKLPSGGSDGQFKSLYADYNNNFSSLSSVWRGALVGNYGMESLSNHGTNGRWWSSSISDDDYARSIGQASASFAAEGNNVKRLGYSVRCIYEPSN